uniref:NADH-ubiquinone oxidoreductase chain 6 n=1 Tax=Teloganodidae sp. MT-2014 TaxID=1560024 RepID=A0A0A0RVS1_9INSE|nr:NADH dehydrogenase subunit 6 [Teloganodidae sp. MT-2014]
MVVILMICLMNLAWLFFLMSHPLSMGLVLLLQTVTISILTGLMNFNSWFSYVLFLVFLGGMLILFIYMTSLAPNEKFYFSPYFFLSFICTAVLLPVIGGISYFSNESLLNFNINSNYFYFASGETVGYPSLFAKIFSFVSSYFTLFLALYLFFVLIVVVFLTKKEKGPTRSFK